MLLTPWILNTFLMICWVRSAPSHKMILRIRDIVVQDNELFFAMFLIFHLVFCALLINNHLVFERYAFQLGIHFAWFFRAIEKYKKLRSCISEKANTEWGIIVDLLLWYTNTSLSSFQIHRRSKVSIKWRWWLKSYIYWRKNFHSCWKF